MTAIDTNILIRFLVRDDAKQAEKVRKRLITAEQERVQLWVPLLVVIETIWVLESAYQKERAEILSAIELLLQMPVFDFEKPGMYEAFLQDGRKTNVDLDDILIAHSAQSSGCDSGLTFDKAAAKLPFFCLLK